jgi:cobalamin biosynthesis protein CobD/CbiB
MANITTGAALVCRILLGAFALVVVYFASYFAAWSLSARTRVSAPIDWVIYTPIPFLWRLQMAQFWMTVDPKIPVYHRG